MIPRMIFCENRAVIRRFAMSHISIRPGDSLTVADDIIIQFDKFMGGCSHLDIYDAYNEISVVRGPAMELTEEEIQAHLWELSREIMDGLSKLEPAGRSELLGELVREMYYSAAAQERREKITAGRRRVSPRRRPGVHGLVRPESPCRTILMNTTGNGGTASSPCARRRRPAGWQSPRFMARSCARSKLLTAPAD